MRKLFPVVMLAALVGAWLYVDTALEANEDLTVIQPLPNAAMSGPSALDQAWFCPTGSRSVGGVADHTVKISNLSAETASTAAVTVLTEAGRGSSSDLEVPPGETISIKASDIDPVTDEDSSELAGLTVQIVGGRSVVSHSVESSAGGCLLSDLVFRNWACQGRFARVHNVDEPLSGRCQR